MRAVYRNPKELATKIKDLIDSYEENLISYEKLEQTVKKMIEVNEDRVYKNGHMPVKLSNVLGKERVEIINKIAENVK